MKLTRRRLFFAAVIAVGLAFTAIVGWRVHRAWQNHQVKEWVESYGGFVDWGFSSQTPEILHRIFGEAVMDEIHAIHVSGSFPISESDMEILSQLPRLESVTLSSNGITDEHIAILAESRSIRYLNLERAAISDEALRIIAQRMPQIRSLDVSGTGISDKGVEFLETASSDLQHLICYRTGISEAMTAKIKAAGILLDHGDLSKK